MARDYQTPMRLVTNSGTVSAGGTITPANGQAIAGSACNRPLVIQVKNAGTGSGTVTISAGVYPPAFRQGMGSIVDVIPTLTEKLYVLESARVAQLNGDIYLDFNTGFVGNTFVYQLPQDF